MRRSPVTTDDIDRGVGGFLPDTGCDLHAHCLTCPLHVCRYEMAPGVARAEMQALTLAAHLRAGKTLDETAEAMGISRRTAYRLKKQTGGVDGRAVGDGA